MICRYSRRAERELAFILSYIAERSPSGARRVAASLRENVRFIADNPRGGQQTRKPFVFAKIVHGYPYKIFYRIRSETIEIIHIRHSARQPWFE